MATEKRLTDANALLAEVVKAQALEPDKAIAKIITLLTEAESVDAVEVVHGKWTTTYTVDAWMGISKIDGYVCGECGKGSKVKGNYCPNCGADMRGAEDG